MVNSLAERGGEFPSNSEMKAIQDSLQTIKNIANVGHVRVIDEELDAEIAKQINIANNESKVEQATIQAKIDEFIQKKREILMEYGYTLGNLPSVSDVGWQTVFDVEPESNIIPKNIKITFSRVAFKETINEKVITTKIKDPEADGNVFFSNTRAYY